MRNKNHSRVCLHRLLMFVFALIVGGCQTLKKQPDQLPPQEKLSNLGGEAVWLGNATLEITYQNIRLGINPHPQAPFKSINELDYLIQTTSQIENEEWFKSQIPQSMKIVLPTDLSAKCKSLGYAAVKDLDVGSRLLLKKEDHYLFLTKILPASMTKHESYFLEFGNGRNLLILFTPTEETSARAFLYKLRDEGKEAHLGFFVDAPVINQSSFPLNEEKAVSLFQPHVAVSAGASPSASINEIKAQLKSEFYEGSFYQAGKNEKFPF